ncbi:MAG: BatA and WFA domain-containing protein, partial [Planctomycetaceae bacterium]|nr:BatA and WFA domain-containing protein [Planctomycetaceae bacterium]
MTFLSPWSFLWLLATVPVVVLYLIRQRPQTIVISTTMFWDLVVARQANRWWSPQVARWLSLLLQLVVIVLLATILAEPRFSGSAADQTESIVLVLDNSASMNAVENGQSRFDRARASLLTAVRHKSPAQKLAIVTTAGPPALACGFTDSGELLEAAIRNVTSTDAADQLNHVWQIVQSLTTSERPPKIRLFSDECFGTPAGTETSGVSAEQAVLAEADVEILRIGEPAANVGITQFQVRRSLLDPAAFELLIEVRDFSDSAIAVQLEILLEDLVLDVVPIHFDVQGQWTLTPEYVSATGGVLRAKLLPIDASSSSSASFDALGADNMAWAVLPAVHRTDVRLISEENPFLRQVLEANPLVHQVVTTTSDATESAEHLASDVDRSGDAGSVQLPMIAVFDRPELPDIPAGAALVIAPAVSTELWTVGNSIERPTVVRRSDESPLLTHVDLNDVLIEEAVQLQFTGPHEVLLETVQG